MEKIWQDMYQAALNVLNPREVSSKIEAGGVAAAVESESGKIYVGVCVDTAENGQEAVDKFADRPLDFYHAVLMDIRMPVMDGLSATRAIRELDRNDAKTVPIIAMTANAFEEDRRLAIKAGMNGYLVKPIDINKLFEELKKFS